MKKVLYSLAILALSLSTFSCGDNANTEKQVEATEIGKAEPQQVEVLYHNIKSADRFLLSYLQIFYIVRKLRMRPD